MVLNSIAWLEFHLDQDKLDPTIRPHSPTFLLLSENHWFRPPISYQFFCRAPFCTVKIILNVCKGTLRCMTPESCTSSQLSLCGLISLVFTCQIWLFSGNHRDFSLLKHPYFPFRCIVNYLFCVSLISVSKGICRT